MFSCAHHPGLHRRRTVGAEEILIEFCIKSTKEEEVENGTILKDFYLFLRVTGKTEEKSKKLQLDRFASLFFSIRAFNSDTFSAE